MKKLVLGMVLVLAVVLIAAPMALAVYGPSVVPDNGTVGTEVTVTGQGLPGEVFDFTFCTKEIPVGQTIADIETGMYAFKFAVPTNADVGECHLRSTGDQGTIVDVTFTVAATPTLAYTGAQIVFWILGGLGIAAIGAGLLMKRRTVTG